MKWERIGGLALMASLACSFDATGGAEGAASIGMSAGSTGATSSASIGTSAPGSTASAETSTTTDDPTSSPATSQGPSTSPGTTDTDEGSSSTTSVELPDGLVERGLVARYLLLEANSGTRPTMTADHAEEPWDLPIDFTDGNVHWTEDSGNRGIGFDSAGAQGGPLRLIQGSKFEMLDGRRRATIEVVVAVVDVVDQMSRIFHIGTGSNGGDFTLRSGDPTELFFTLNDQDIVGYPVDFVPLGRAVIHLVFDSTQGNPADRARLYVNGGLVEPDSGSGVAMNAAVELSNSPYISLGNREGDRSIEGAIYYAALYGVALNVAEVEHNAALLFEDDDSEG